MTRVLGFDWMLSLLHKGSHNGTVFLALRILLACISHPTLLGRFKEGTVDGILAGNSKREFLNSRKIIVAFVCWLDLKFRLSDPKVDLLFRVRKISFYTGTFLNKNFFIKKILFNFLTLFLLLPTLECSVFGREIQTLFM